MIHKEIAIDQCGFKGFAKSGELIVQVLAAKQKFFPLACIQVLSHCRSTEILQLWWKALEFWLARDSLAGMQWLYNLPHKLVHLGFVEYVFAGPAGRHSMFISCGYDSLSFFSKCIWIGCLPNVLKITTQSQDSSPSETHERVVGQQRWRVHMVLAVQTFWQCHPVAARPKLAGRPGEVRALCPLPT